MADTKKKKLGSGRHKQAIKRNRQNKKRRLRNKAAISAIKTAIKKAIGNRDNIIEAQSLVARAIKRGIFHEKTGWRKISHLHRLPQHPSP